MKKKGMFIFLLILAIAAGLFFYLKKRKKAASENLGVFTPGKPGSPQPGKTTESGSSPWPLQRGSKNTYVSALQGWLNDNKGAKLVIDGDFGTKTEAAVKSAGIPIPIDLAGFNKIWGK
jgi:hypothetical protein